MNATTHFPGPSPTTASRSSHFLHEESSREMFMDEPNIPVSRTVGVPLVPLISVFDLDRFHDFEAPNSLTR